MEETFSGIYFFANYHIPAKRKRAICEIFENFVTRLYYTSNKASRNYERRRDFMQILGSQTFTANSWYFVNGEE